jgi:purine-binding chemotaxis protein CheW
MKQLLPFKIGDELYALELVEVQEVVENRNIYNFPGSPEVVVGAIGFHGRIVPVINLPLLLNFPTENLCNRLIVLLNEQGPVALGVDQVRSVINIEEVPENQMQHAAERNYINKTINWNGEMISLFDLEQLQAKLESLCVQLGD